MVRVRAFEALRHREYRLLWYGQVFGSMGTWMDQVTRGWLIYELTNSALQLGLVRGIQADPFSIAVAHRGQRCGSLLRASSRWSLRNSPVGFYTR